MEKIPEFHTEICSPDKKYRIVPIYDYIKTLEKTPAGLPYGSSSGSWGSSGSMWTEQHGTPIGFEFTYYATYENKYYHIDADFDVEHMKDMVDRCYSGGDQDSATPVKEFVSRKELKDIQMKDGSDRSYSPLTTLVFGFAPQGMVVVWMRYSGANCIELGRYQAKEITDEQKIAQYRKKYESKYRLEGDSYKVQVKDMHIDNPTSKPWDDYRIKYNWNYKVTSDNKEFKLFHFDSAYFNGEKEAQFRPTVLKPAMKKRAIPEIINIYFEISARERYIGRFFFDWNKMNELLKKSGEQNTFQFHVSEDNNKIEVLLNNQKIEIDSIRIYPNNVTKYRESYK
ncbi:DUF2931 family protein [Flavobacterium sp.]|uniref:DUF2931 family protein n=1 Tax=Flavobacterium sp. TaxID=239 RepID=UPI00286D1AEC|nr:DUF2931 family protein [Flavobacterium sp.]